MNLISRQTFSFETLIWLDSNQSQNQKTCDVIQTSARRPWRRVDGRMTPHWRGSVDTGLRLPLTFVYHNGRCSLTRHCHQLKNTNCCTPPCLGRKCPASSAIILCLWASVIHSRVRFHTKLTLTLLDQTCPWWVCISETILHVTRWWYCVVVQFVRNYINDK